MYRISSFSSCDFDLLFIFTRIFNGDVIKATKDKTWRIFYKNLCSLFSENHSEYDDYLKLSWEIRFYLIKIISYKNIAELFLYQMVTTRFKWLIAKL